MVKSSPSSSLTSQRRMIIVRAESLDSKKRINKWLIRKYTRNAMPG
ncbi:MAG: hypothetical protein ACFE7S_02705 [Candidatus Hodarchaeota archaeon]